MKIYIRKIFNHDITHEVSVSKPIVSAFFDSKESFTARGIKSKESVLITINSVTDPRFGGKCKDLLSKEGGIVVNDLIVFYKDRNEYLLEIIKLDDKRYTTFSELFNTATDRHKIIYTDEPEVRDASDICSCDKPHQRIFFGAPGTGKSHKLNEEAKQYFGDNFKRVTFHPNYMYSNFVGQYKPYPSEDNPEKITYKFVPGILIRQIVEALKNPDKNYLVIIEEINRANVASVFGDLFQLLDRTSNGESEYSITVTKELQDYFKNEAFKNEESNNNSLFIDIQNKLNDFSELYLPHNLYIWATMNSADQGVMPMDTAFKRRWEFTYLGVNDSADNNIDEFKTYVFEVNGETYNWDIYRRGINDRLSNLNIPEDKLLGPYFLSKNILSNENKSYITEVLKNKVLMYLYEDAGRAFRGRLFRDETYNTYSQLCAEFDKDPLSIFKEPIEISESSSEES